MMTRAGRWGAALLAASTTFGAAPAAAQGTTGAVHATSRPYVVLVSFDAFRHDYIDRLHPPALEALASRGVRAEAIIPAFPSKTFPNHYSLATGLYPGHHGIVGNSFYDPVSGGVYRSGDTLAVRDGGWYGGEPIWVTAEKNGVHAASYFWPGSEAAIGGVRPSLFMTYDAHTPDSARVDGVVRWLRRPPETRPHLVLLYMSDVDDTTHRYGPDAPNTAHAVANVDRALRRLLDSVAVLPMHDSVNVVVVSDHGMTAVSAERATNVLDVLARAGVNTNGILASDNGPTMSLWFNGDTARLTRARRVLGAQLARADVYVRDSIPPRLHTAGNPRFGDLLLVAWPGTLLQQHATDKAPSVGAHGFDPAWEDMWGIFVAAGPNIAPAGHIPAFENVNLYPFIAALLQLEHVPRVDGDLRVLGSFVRR